MTGWEGIHNSEQPGKPVPILYCATCRRAHEPKACHVPVKEPLLMAEVRPRNPVDVIEQIAEGVAAREGREVDRESFAVARAYCDQLVEPPRVRAWRRRREIGAALACYQYMVAVIWGLWALALGGSLAWPGALLAGAITMAAMVLLDRRPR